MEYGLLADDAFGFPGRPKPLVQTRRMEFVRTGRACEEGEREGFGVEDGIADGAGLHTVELFLEVLFP